MHKSAYALAFLATMSAASFAQAEDDFSALLADLDFSDAPSMHQTLTPVSEPQEPLQQFSMPDLAMPESADPAPAPLVTLQEPVSTESQPEYEKIDLEAAFALQESKSGPEATAVGHFCNQGAKENCDEGEFCTPYRRPSLPSSTFYQAFRTNRCNTGVWDGYQQRCRSANKHLNGTCDCFNKKQDCCGEVLDAPVVECAPCNAMPRHRALPLRKNCDDCTKCDTGCDS